MFIPTLGQWYADVGDFIEIKYFYLYIEMNLDYESKLTLTNF